MLSKGHKVFVGGLNYNTTDRSLAAYFERYGPLEDYIVIKTSEHKSRGFGFVIFQNEDDMEKVLRTPKDHVVDGRTVEIKSATPREETSGGGVKFKRSNDGGSLVTAGGDKQSKIMRKLFVGGLNYETSEDDVGQYFKQFGPLQEHVLMKFPDSGRSKGFGFVVYEHAEDLDRCQDARPHKIDGKTVDTKRATPVSASGKPEAVASVKKIFVAGLKDDISDAELENYFAQFGRVTNVEQMLWNETKRKRGFGFVEFNDNDIVDKVVLLGGHNINGYELDCKKALSKDEMREAEERVEYQDSRRRRGRGGDEDGPPAKRGRNSDMEQQWNNSGFGNSGFGGFGNGGGYGGGNNGGYGGGYGAGNGGGNNGGFGNMNMNSGDFGGGMNPMKMMQMMMGMFASGAAASQGQQQPPLPPQGYGASQGPPANHGGQGVTDVPTQVMSQMMGMMSGGGGVPAPPSGGSNRGGSIKSESSGQKGGAAASGYGGSAGGYGSWGSNSGSQQGNQQYGPYWGGAQPGAGQSSGGWGSQQSAAGGQSAGGKGGSGSAGGYGSGWGSSGGYGSSY